MSRFVYFGLVGCLVGSVVLVGVWGWLALQWSPPTNFEATTVVVPRGVSVTEIADILETNGVIRSTLAFRFLFLTQFDPTTVKAGSYTFTTAPTARVVALELVRGQFDSDLLSLTFVEGETNADFSVTARTLASFEQTAWQAATVGREGYLFPDTYLVAKDFSVAELVDLLMTEHQSVLMELQNQYGSTTYTNTELVTLASLVEREANTAESMRIVAGIFNNRLELGMALQADASIGYVLDTPLNELRAGQLASSLRELDSPYNTYLYPGLPPTPICNPGRQALAAVFNPIESDYLYYITGNDGEFYYAETYQQHLQNIERYLR